MPKPEKKAVSKQAKSAKSAKAVKPKKVEKKIHKAKKISNPLFEKKSKVFAIGRDINTKRDLTRYVRWPKYIRLQRQRRILYSRLKVPPAINQFSKTLDKNTAIEAFKLLSKYKPESKTEKKKRLLASAKIIVQRRNILTRTRKAINKKIKEGRAKSRALKKGTEPTKTEEKPKKEKKDKKKYEKPVLPAAPSNRSRKYCVKYGINHITSLVEQKKAKIVFIANDVDPIELVVWLPTLCKKMGVAYCIVKNKARLGTLVGKKNATAVALTDVNDEHKDVLANLIEAVNKNYTAKYEETRKQWGGGVMGLKSRQRTKKKAEFAAAEKAKISGGK